MKTSFLMVLTLSIAVSTAAMGQSLNVSKRGTTAAPFLSIAQGARAVGMGGAFVAVADDQSSMYWNPAGIADIPGISVVLDHTYWIADIQYDYVGTTVNMGSIGTLGVNVTSSNIPDMRVTTVDAQDGTGEVFGVSDLALGVTYAIRLTDNFSIGFNPIFIYQKIWKMSASGIALDMGVKYRMPFKGFTLGMSISNFGSKMQMTGENANVLYDPDQQTTGNNGRIPSAVSTDEWDLPLNFRVGIAYDVATGDFGKLILAVDALHPNDNYESLNLGGEYLINDVLYLRGGYKSLFLKDSEERMTAGIGVKEYLVGNVQVSVDYAYQGFARLKTAQKISLGVTF
jgi:long-subunit fatty acid transport protein